MMRKERKSRERGRVFITFSAGTIEHGLMGSKLRGPRGERPKEE